MTERELLVEIRDLLREIRAYIHLNTPRRPFLSEIRQPTVKDES